jgi:hypothetical protein
MVTASERRKKRWVKIPKTPCFCVRKGKWERCGVCGDVVTGEKEMSAAMCVGCARATAESTDLVFKEEEWV